ncbi:hypothetical protein BJX62DRAFT_248345 [Aspergillus germanicus]
MKLHAQSAPSGPAGSDDSGSRNGQDGSRKRCHTACTQCRSLRIKCSGTLPCGSCLSASRRCNYKHSSGRVSHLQNEPDATPFDSAVNHPQGPRNDEVVSHDRPPSQNQIHTGPPTPNSVPPASVVHTDRPLDTLSAQLQAPEILSFHNGFAVDNNNISQSKAAVNPPNSCPDFQVFDFDAISWPLLHENLDLVTEFDFTTTSSMLGLQPAQLEPTSSQILLEEGESETPDSLMGANITLGASNIDSGLDGHSTDYSTNATLDCHSPQQTVQDLIAYGMRQQQQKGRISVALDHSSFWHEMSPQVASAFRISCFPDPSNLLYHLIDLYFDNFEPLWPLFSPQDLQINRMHPLLFLVLTSIGAMYGDKACSLYGILMHNQIRSCLVQPLELDDTDGDFLWLMQARSHTMGAALYFGQPKAFSFAQHLGALLVGQARRMDLFTSTDSCLRHLNQQGSSISDTDRQALWLHVEGKRRLAFAIFRAETYTSVLLQKRPLLTMKDITLMLPSCDPVWASERLPAHLCLQMIKHDRTPSRHLKASDLIHIALDQAEPLPPLDPTAYELLLLGLQSCIWGFVSDPSLFNRLTGITRDGETCHSSSQDFDLSSTTQHIHMGSPVDDRLPPETLDPSEVDHLESTSRKMRDLSHDNTRLLSALQKCESSLPLVKAFVHSDRDRTYLMSGLILLHLGHLLLSAPVNSLHEIQYLLADGKIPDNELLGSTFQWANSPRAVLAAKRAISIWSLIANTSLERDGQILKFNLVAMLGLHHAVVVLWAYAGACKAANTATEEVSALSLHATQSPAHLPIPINRENTPRIVHCFIWAYALVSSSRWSSFAKVAQTLALLTFPSNGHQ